MSSKLGPIRAALKTIVEATSITSCYMGNVPADATTAKPYATLDIAGGGGVTFDINSRNRPVFPVPIVLYCDVNTQETATLPFEQMDTAIEELIIAFDNTTNRATLLALDGLIDFWIVDVQLDPSGEYAVMDCRLEMDYPY